MSARRWSRACSIAAPRGAGCVAVVEAAQPLPAPGTPDLAGERGIGTLGTVAGSSGLAIVRIDRVAEALARGRRR